MSSFSSGKWRACIDGSVDIEDESGRVITTYSDIIGLLNDAESRANARLIASAPELYELLQEWYNDELEYGIPVPARHERMRELFEYINY